jgi:hypothetical protein
MTPLALSAIQIIAVENFIQSTIEGVDRENKALVPQKESARLLKVDPQGAYQSFFYALSKRKTSRKGVCLFF